MCETELHQILLKYEMQAFQNTNAKIYIYEALKTLVVNIYNYYKKT